MAKARKLAVYNKEYPRKKAEEWWNYFEGQLVGALKAQRLQPLKELTIALCAGAILDTLRKLQDE